MTPFLRIALVLLAVAPAPAEAARSPSQGGYSTEKHVEHGITFPRARSYKRIPTKPNEALVILKYTEKLREDRRSRGYHPDMLVLRIDYIPDVAPKTPGPGESGDPDEPEEPEEPAETDEEGDTGVEEEEEKPPPPPINNFERYLAQRGRGWTAGEASEGKERGDWKATEYELVRPPKSRGNLAGWAYVWEKERERTIAVLGYCPEERLEEQAKIWRNTAAKMKFSEPAPNPQRRKWERFYARRKYVDPAYRIETRLSLPEKWKAEDTENYIVVYDTKDQPLVRKIVRDIELIRAEYEALFPPAGPIEAVSTVRVCEDRDEYFEYGGPRGSAGYWNYRDEELVLYDATKREKGERTDKTDTFIVLYHEAFHQFIHYSAGELAPHSWYNEGTGDFFSGAVVKNGRVRRIGPNRWRVNTIKRAVAEGKHISWEKIIRFEQKDYYANPGLCYAQGWSMIYFLNTSKTVASHPRWSEILTVYFEELKRAWATEQERLGEEGRADEKARGEAQLAARTCAVDVAFEGVDIGELQGEWESFVRGLEALER
ncbi:MAG: hypothetical protein CMJ84_04300 [Planctomycetes bacterium]|jgi:hypothetical protein|nr:hypothetical protein [Planctomycetota bacterium]MDP6408479.1 hypothetical protein [Planctomycetota bacterium]